MLQKDFPDFIAYIKNKMCNIAYRNLSRQEKKYNYMRILFLSLLLFLNVFTVFAQKDIKEIIKNIPEEIIPYIQDGQRAEIYKFIESNDTFKIKNTLNGTTSIDSIGKGFAKISLNDIADLQIRLFPYQDSTEIICLVKTIYKPVKESIVQFFSSEWNKIDEDFNLPQTKDTDLLIESFIERPDSMSKKQFIELSSYIDPIIINADVSSTDYTIEYNLSLPFIQEKQSKEIKAIIKQNTFKWDGRKFKKC